MPEVDQEKLNDAKMLDIAKPPMRDKAFEKFPQMMYRHPKVHYRKQTFKDGHGNVTEETFANEHLTKLVKNEDELAKSLKQGWVEKPFIAPPVEVHEDPLYAVEQEKAPEAYYGTLRPAPTTAQTGLSAIQPVSRTGLNTMSKVQLVEYGATLGLTLDVSSKKDELIAQIQRA